MSMEATLNYLHNFTYFIQKLHDEKRIAKRKKETVKGIKVQTYTKK